MHNLLQLTTAINTELHQTINNNKVRKGEQAKFIDLLKTAFESTPEED